MRFGNYPHGYDDLEPVGESVLPRRNSAARSKRLGNVGPSIIPDSRAFHTQHRIEPALRATTTADATRYRTEALALLDDLIRTARLGHAQVVAVGLPTTPKIHNGTRMATYYKRLLVGACREPHAVVACRTEASTHDLVRFRTSFAALRVSALGAGEVQGPYWGGAQTLDTSHALETQFRSDRDCYWLGD